MRKTIGDVTEEAMEVLRPVYGHDPVKKALTNVMAKEAARSFLKENRTFASAMMEVAVDYTDYAQMGFIPGLRSQKDKAAFYDRHSDLFIKKAEDICHTYDSYSWIDEYIPNVAGDDKIIEPGTKASVVDFVLDAEIMTLKNDISLCRNDLEKITKEKAQEKTRPVIFVKQEHAIKNIKDNVKGKMNSNDNGIAM